MSYRDRAVLVIGGLGFIGGRLSSALADQGSRVTIVTPSREKHHDAAIDLEARGIRVLDGDVRDRGQMESAVRGQHLIFNLAGQSGAVRSMEEPWDDLDVPRFRRWIVRQLEFIGLAGDRRETANHGGDQRTSETRTETKTLSPG